MELSTPLVYAGDPRAAADRAAALESAGLDAVWVAEAYGFDSPTIMGYLAARTERMRIGSAILNVYSRTPALIAQTAAGLDALTGGRALLGVGASGPQVVEGWHGRRYDRPLGRTREVIGLSRRIWRREVIEHHGITDLPLPAEKGGTLGKPLKLLTHPVRDTIPVYVAALGPANVRMTAELADGWLPFLYVPEHAAKVWGASGRNFYHDLVCSYGYESAAAAVQEHYLAGRKKDAEAAVPAELLELLCLAGPEGYVRDRVEVFREAGVTMLNVTPVGPDPARLVERVRSWL